MAKRVMLALLVGWCAWVGMSGQIVPTPLAVLPGRGAFNLSGDTQVYTNLGPEYNQFLKSYLPTLFPVGEVRGQEAAFTDSDVPSIVIRCNVPDVTAEQAADDVSLQGYSLQVQPDRILILSETPTGAFYALQSLSQLMRPDGTVEAMTVHDLPRFPYRGVLLDASRHFWPKEVLYDEIDRMAAVKLNRLHFHLTDAGGWRMQSERYPLLTQKTGWRTQEDWQRWWIDRDRQYCDSTREGAYGGYYTKQDLRDIVKYAAERNIVVVPEIEMPGHSEEVNFAYPELSCSGIPGKDGELCIGNPATFRFIEEVLDEVMEIFPSPYIHIGGDECAHTAWLNCKRCQALMQSEQIETPELLQTYLTDSIGRYLASHGRRLIGWDEIMDGAPEPSSAVMSWRGTSGGIRAALGGHRVVMCPGSHCYLDQPADTLAAHRHHPSAPRGPLSLEKVYSFEPVPTELAGTPAASLVMGVQGNLWAEWIPTQQVMDFLLWPRAIAIAQVGWSTHKPPFRHFTDALRNRGLIE